MKRLIAVAGLLVALALPASSAAFHHGQLPARFCAASDMASANPTARAAIAEHNPAQEPGRTFPPNGTPGQGKGQGEEHCAATQE